MRSSWKNNAILLGNATKFMAPSKMWVGPSLLDKRILVYNGKKLEPITVRSYMLYRRLSHFIVSKYTGKTIHVKRKKRKVKKNAY